jgi:hypothetical protein
MSYCVYSLCKHKQDGLLIAKKSFININIRKQTEIEMKIPNNALIINDPERTRTHTLTWEHKSIVLAYFTASYLIISVI